MNDSAGRSSPDRPDPDPGHARRTDRDADAGRLPPWTGRCARRRRHPAGGVPVSCRLPRTAASSFMSRSPPTTRCCPRWRRCPSPPHASNARCTTCTGSCRSITQSPADWSDTHTGRPAGTRCATTPDHRRPSPTPRHTHSWQWSATGSMRSRWDPSTPASSNPDTSASPSSGRASSSSRPGSGSPTVASRSSSKASTPPAPSTWPNGSAVTPPPLTPWHTASPLKTPSASPCPNRPTGCAP